MVPAKPLLALTAAVLAVHILMLQPPRQAVQAAHHGDLDGHVADEPRQLREHPQAVGETITLVRTNPATGAEVVGYSLPPTTDPNLFEAADVARGMTSLTGDVRDPGGREARVEEILHVLEDEPRRRAMGAAARELAQAEYGWETIARRLAGIYELVTGRSRAGARV